MLEQNCPSLKSRWLEAQERGTNAITRIGLLVPSYDSLLYWKKRFELLDVKHGELTMYAGRDALHFEDCEGLRLVLLNNNDDEVPALLAVMG